jgi:predicted outer membrane lipoprotein
VFTAWVRTQEDGAFFDDLLSWGGIGVRLLDKDSAVANGSEIRQALGHGSAVLGPLLAVGFGEHVVEEALCVAWSGVRLALACQFGVIAFGMG